MEPIYDIMPKAGKFIEVFIVVSVTLVAGVTVAHSTAYGAVALEASYGNDNGMFPLITQLAMSAPAWAPIFYGVLLIAYVLTSILRPQWRWASWCLLCIVVLTVLLVLYGITAPYATTTFDVGV